MLAAIILYISSVSLHLENRPMLFFLTYHFLCPFKKKKKCLKIKEWCIENKIRSSIFMFNSNAIWREILLQTLTWLCLPRQELWRANTDITVIKKLQAERGGLSVNIRVYMMSSCFTHCGTSNLSSMFYFANSNFIMPVNIIIFIISIHVVNCYII